MTTLVNRFKDGASVARNAAEAFFEKMDEILAEKPEAHVAITGGTVGIATLAEIAANPRAASFDFNRINFWWGDERFVPAADGDRNALQAHNALFSKISIDSSKLHPFPSADNGLTLDEAAAQFAEYVATVKPHFDLVLLGMGPDGHINSLFPGKATPEAGLQIVAEHDSPKPPPQRLTFTYEAMNAADEIWFTVAGADKADAVNVAFGDDPTSLPVGRVHGVKRTVWFVDQTAGQTTWGC
ncbi:MAG: 6-phosphogluconolactonase [Rhodoluna sp.]|nr:6-phosphogluconolactonase [Rhodoluna sp.]